MSRRAVILAGGKGTRLRPYTVAIPKPLVPISGVPILEIVIQQLAQAGFDHITLAINHQASIIRAFCQTGERWNVKIDYSFEKQPLGTIGPLRLIADLPDNFLIMNGDTLTDLDYLALYNQHVNSKDIMTISCTQRETWVDYGVLELSNEKLVGFREKPSYAHHVCMGINMVSRPILEMIPPDQPYGFDDLMHDLLACNTPAAVYPFHGYWLDIGRPDDYEKANRDFEKGLGRFLPSAA